MEKAEEFIALERFRDLIHHLRSPLQHPAVQQRQLRHRDGVVGWIEIVEVAQQVAAGVAHFAVDISELAKDAGTDRHISGVVNRAHPQAEYISAVGRFLFLVLAALDDHHRVDNVAQRLAHLATFFIQGETVGEDSLVGGMTIDGHRCQQ